MRGACGEPKAGTARRSSPQRRWSALHRKLHDAGARASTGATPRRRHALRIRVKRLRYSCEFFAAGVPGEARDALHRARSKALQDILGELNDIAVGRRLLGFDGDEAALLRRLGPALARARAPAGILARGEHEHLVLRPAKRRRG